MSAVAQVIDLFKKCSACGETKNVANFYRNTKRRDGRSTYCKPCDSRIRMGRYHVPELRDERNLQRRMRRKDPSYSARKGRKPHSFYAKAAERSRMKRVYGMTLDQARDMLRAQFNLCANRACGKELTFDVHGHAINRAVIDHCHATKVVRGILCHKCNTTAGVLEKNRNLVIGLSEYLARNSAGET